MDFLADECVARDIVTALRNAGHQVRYASDIMAGFEDSMLLEHSHKEQYIFLTADYDFVDLVFRHNKYGFGILIVSPEFLRNVLAGNLDLLVGRISSLGDTLIGRLTIVESDRTRQRTLPRT